MPPGKLDGRVALITGGANGIGRASVELFASEGAKVAFIDFDLEAGSRLQREMLAKGRDVFFLEGNVSVEKDVERCVDQVKVHFGPIDILFNHAGIIMAKPFLEFSAEDWEQMMNYNARSVFLMTRAVLPGMLAKGRGVIVNTSSSSVKAACAMEAVYCGSKAAMHQFCRAIAVEFRDAGIRCNLICPSFVRTKHGHDEISQLKRYGVFASEDSVNYMQGRICEPEEVASVALFLASDESSFINGAEIFVDNTFTAV